MKLDADAKVGGTVFRKGIPWATVIACAQRQAAGPALATEQARAFREQFEPAVATDDDKDYTLAFLWKWIDRLARGESSSREFLSVVSYYPNAPKWLHGRPAEPKPTKEIAT